MGMAAHFSRGREMQECGGPWGPAERRKRSVAVQFLAFFAPFLGFQGQGGGGTGKQTGNADGFTRCIAPAVLARIDGGDGLWHLLEQLAFAIAGTQLAGVFLLDGRAVWRVG